MKKNFFNYREMRQKVLLTNDLGRYVFLSKEEFYRFLRDQLDPQEEITQRLMDEFFLYDGSEYEFVERAGEAFRMYRRNLFQGAALHIFVLTKQCNQQCVYCQASTELERHTQMSGETAAKAVDIALQTTAQYVTFEFQGGEPLMNFDTLQFIVEYAEEQNQSCGKNLEFSVVTNLMLLDEEKLEFLTKHGVSICTSLDGDEILHNKNRPYFQQNTFEILKKKIQMIQDKGASVSAIQTTTRDSLPRYREMVDQYLAFGLNQITIRPLTQLGYAAKNWTKIGYTVDEFLNFYRKSLDYIIERNQQGTFILEGHARMFLSKIFCRDAGNYMELRSPCGGAIGQLAYYYNGKVYSCDEARMLAEMGDDSFCLGNVEQDTYESIVSNPVCKTIAKSSCLEGLADCDGCVYQPYCGTCPVISYARYQTVYPSMLQEYRCRIYKGIQDILFEKLEQQDEEVVEIFRRWCE